MTSTLCDTCDKDSRYAAAMAENAMLRELVQSYHSAMRCMLETGIWPTDPMWLEHRMCELGVEVDA